MLASRVNDGRDGLQRVDVGQPTTANPPRSWTDRYLQEEAPSRTLHRPTRNRTTVTYVVTLDAHRDQVID
jgi:hypothetical protein